MADSDISAERAAVDIVRWQIMLDHFPHQSGTFITECRRMLAELAAERARHETTDNERATFEALAAQHYHEARALRAKVRAVEMLHCWTNEDGRRFVFADDLAVALEIPGALAAASPSPIAGQNQRD